jgi:hypothetical protein
VQVRELILGLILDELLLILLVEHLLFIGLGGEGVLAVEVLVEVVVVELCCEAWVHH